MPSSYPAGYELLAPHWSVPLVFVALILLVIGGWLLGKRVK